jgi:hypothetical protein
MIDRAPQLRYCKKKSSKYTHGKYTYVYFDDFYLRVYRVTVVWSTADWLMNDSLDRPPISTATERMEGSPVYNTSD